MIIEYIILHCSATEEGLEVDICDIDRWHRKEGMVCIGYHYVIPLSGKLQQGRVVGTKGAHCRGHNDHSIGICYVGGLREGKPADTRTPAQLARMEMLVKDLLVSYPYAKVCGHHDLNPQKACPCFNVREWAMSVGIPQKNIL